MRSMEGPPRLAARRRRLHSQRKRHMTMTSRNTSLVVAAGCGQSPLNSSIAETNSSSCILNYGWVDS